MKPARTLAYLISQYPAISHTFILREVLELRARGFDIRTASVNPTDRPPEQLTAEERQEASQTWYLKPQGPRGVLAALIGTLKRHPLGLIRGLWRALELAGLHPRSILYHLAYWIEAVMIGEWMRSQDARHLHVHFATPAATVGLLTRVIFPVGFSFTAHGPDEFYDVPGYLLREKIAAADFVICISHYARSQLMKLSPVEEWGKFEICRLGVDPDRFFPCPAPVSGDAFKILCVGRLSPAKGQHILLSALAKLIDQGRRVKLTLVGRGPDEASLARHASRLGIADSVSFAGAVNQDDILAIYHQAQAFVLPSFAEGLPVVLMEAMALGIPCVTTHITGVPELIRDNVEGLLIAPSDDDGLARALGRLMDDKTLGPRLATAGRARVLAEYTLSESVAHLADTVSRRLGPPA